MFTEDWMQLEAPELLGNRSVTFVVYLALPGKKDLRLGVVYPTEVPRITPQNASRDVEVTEYAGRMMLHVESTAVTLSMLQAAADTHARKSSTVVSGLCRVAYEKTVIGGVSIKLHPKA